MSHLFRNIFLCGLVWAGFLAAQAQKLPRRAFLGIQMEPVAGSVRQNLKLPATQGVAIQGVVPGSSAERAGLRAGDVLVQINQKDVGTPAEVVGLMRGYPSGEPVTFGFYHNGGFVARTVPASPFPQETASGFDIAYEQVAVGSALHRSIITKPRKSGKRPAVLFIQGVGCFSMDTPQDTARSETRLLHELTRQGYVTMRVEKSGMGDSKGLPCDQLDFHTEAEGYRQALRQLKALPYVDADNVFLIGHSMGGVMAPVVARDVPVKGIVVYGTLVATFLDHFLNSRRVIAEASAMDPVAADTYVRNACECAYLLLNEKKTVAEAVKINPGCTQTAALFEIRTPTFWEQLNGLVITEYWKSFPGKVLSMRGSTDFVSTAAEHQRLADLVNHYHPGNGRYVALEGTDHGMAFAPTYRDARNNPGAFNPAVARTIAAWLEDTTRRQ